jgi:hypothetical protein
MQKPEMPCNRSKDINAISPACLLPVFLEKKLNFSNILLLFLSKTKFSDSEGEILYFDIAPIEKRSLFSKIT